MIQDSFFGSKDEIVVKPNINLQDSFKLEIKAVESENDENSGSNVNLISDSEESEINQINDED